MTATTITATSDISLDGGSFTFNESSADKDFRVETNGLTHGLFVDGGNNQVTVGASAATQPNVPFSVICGDADSKGIYIARQESGNPSDNEELGSLGFMGVVNTNTMAAADAKIVARAAEAHSGSAAGTDLEFYTKPTGTGPGSGPTERMNISHAGYVTKPSQVYVFASGNGTRHNQTSANTEQSLDFTESTDNTNSFNTSGGIFTAPVAGRYFIHYYASTKSNTSYIQLYVKHNSSIVATDYNELPNNSNDWAAQQVTVILNLSASDTVQPFMVSGGTNAYALENYYRGASIYLLG